MAELTGALDLWNLFVTFTFGNFWMAVFGIIILLFIIMAVLGRVSIYTVTWYCIMFLLAMTLGYGMVLINILVTTALIIAFYFSLKSYIESR